MEDSYIEYIVNNIDKIEDSELRDSVIKLIKERNYLIDTINIDPLTGAYNRRILDSVRKYSVLALCDLDNFKSVNDIYGHDNGDTVLKFFSSALLKNCRANDIVCRLGGDEFLVFFDDCPIEIVQSRMENIQEILSSHVSNVNFKVSFSAGLAVYEEGKTFDETLKEADIALYSSKNDGKKAITRYDSTINKHNVSR